MKKSISFTTLIVIFVMAVLMIFPTLSVPIKTANAESNYTGDYISISQEFRNDVKVVWTFTLGLNTEERGLANESEKQSYRLAMGAVFQRIIDEKIKEINDIYNYKLQTAEDDQKEYIKETFKKENCISISIMMTDLSADKIFFQIVYNNPEAYNFYNGQESDVNKTIENIFINKKIKKRIFPFAKLVETQNGTKTLAQLYRERFIEACSGLSIAEKMKSYDPVFIFDYANSSNRIKSNADLKYTDGVGAYHHAWGERTNSINSDLVMSITLTSANRGWWYLFGTAIPLVVMCVVIAIITIKNKQNKNSKSQEDKMTA